VGVGDGEGGWERRGCGNAPTLVENGFIVPGTLKMKVNGKGIGRKRTDDSLNLCLSVKIHINIAVICAVNIPAPIARVFHDEYSLVPLPSAELMRTLLKCRKVEWIEDKEYEAPGVYVTRK
jgi:hypothetical protein